MTELAPATRATVGTYRAWRRLLREEDAWLLRQIGSERPVVWLRPQPLGAAARHGILALRVGPEAQLRGALRADVGAWPWGDDSLAAIVLQHVCEGAAWSGAILAESARVLAPEGRLYVLRFDRFSPWYWRFGRGVVRRSGAPLFDRPLDFRCVRRQGLGLEYRHSLGGRGLRDGAGLVPKHKRESESSPFASTLRAARVWVLRKRRRQFLISGSVSTARANRPDFGMARGQQRRSGPQ